MLRSVTAAVAERTGREETVQGRFEVHSIGPFLVGFFENSERCWDQWLLELVEEELAVRGQLPDAQP